MSQPFEPTPIQNTEAAKPPVSQDRDVQKIPFHQPQLGPLRHILQETGEKGSSKEYDSYSDNRP